jgi:hypothetical protein
MQYFRIFFNFQTSVSLLSPKCNEFVKTKYITNKFVQTIIRFRLKIKVTFCKEPTSLREYTGKEGRISHTGTTSKKFHIFDMKILAIGDN